MSVKVSFLIFIIVFIIWDISCDKFIPFNPVPYVPRKRYHLSAPTEKADLVAATAKCLTMQMTLATVDDIQEQEILLYQLRKDYALHEAFGSSEFWLIGPNGLNELNPILGSVVPNPFGYSLLAKPHGGDGDRKCVKLVFTPSYVGWVDASCYGRYRFICTEKPHSTRLGSLESDDPKQLYEYMNLTITILKDLKERMCSTDLFEPDRLCPNISMTAPLSVLRDCKKTILKNMEKLMPSDDMENRLSMMIMLVFEFFSGHLDTPSM